MDKVYSKIDFSARLCHQLDTHRNYFYSLSEFNGLPELKISVAIGSASYHRSTENTNSRANSMG